MCTLKLLKALCSVLVTTKIESPVKIKDGSVTLRFLKCPQIEILTCWCLIGILKRIIWEGWRQEPLWAQTEVKPGSDSRLILAFSKTRKDNVLGTKTVNG